MTEKYHHSALPIGTMLRDYRVEAVLGHGGFGITYKARHDTLKNQVVAIKEYLPNDLSVRDDGGTVHPKSSGSDEENYQWGLDRFIQEAQTLANFDHKSIVRILTFFKDNNTAYLVMQFEEGDNLKALYSDKRGEIAEQVLLDTLVYPLLDGLKIVHSQSILHRDIKPENIYVRKDNTPVLLDFGSARQSVSGKSKSLSAIVSSGFAPFEQYSTNGKQGPWTDIYSFGAVLYWLIGGKPADASNRMMAHANEDEDPLNPAVKIGAGNYSSGFLTSIDHALRMTGKNRPQSIEAWLPEFSQVVQEEDGSEAKTRALQRSGQRKRKAEKAAEQAPEASEAKTRALQRSGRKRKRHSVGEEGVVESGSKRLSGLRLMIGLFLVVVLLVGGWQYYQGTQTQKELASDWGTQRDLARKKKEVAGILRLADKALEDKLFSDAERLIKKAKGLEVSGQEIEAAEARLRDAKALEKTAVAEEKKGRQVDELLEKVEKASRVNDFSRALLFLDEAELLGVKSREIASARESVLRAQKRAERKQSQAAAQQSSERGDVGSTWTDSVTGMEFMWVPKGCFQMGSPSSEEDRGSDERQHRVCLSNGYWLGKYEVTQGQWEKVMGNNPSYFKGSRNPVEKVSWDDVQKFIDQLNSRSGETFRLPTEAQWEYAARAGTTTPFSFGNTISTDQVNYNGNYPYENGRKGEYREKTVPVGSLPANRWGFHEMHGNVWEWVQDWYGDYPSNSVTDPTGATSGSRRVRRGGSWDDLAHDCRSAYRYRSSPDNRLITLGFRVLRAH